MENWRAALEWTLTAGGDVILGQRLTGALRHAWEYLAVAEGQRWIRAALRLSARRQRRSLQNSM